MNPREEIKEIAPKLSQWKQGEGYTVPPNYFESLSDQLMKRVEATKNLEPYFQSLPDKVMSKIKQEEKVKVRSIWSYYKYGVAAALLIVAGSFLWNNLNQDFVEPAYAMLDDNEELDYVIDDMSMEDIFDSEFIDDESFDEIIVSGEYQLTSDDWIEDLLIDADDEILEDFL